jgi:transposase
MKELPDLSELDSKGKDALIGELWAEIQKLREKIESKPKKNPKNSSLPPAKGFKANLKSEASSEGKRAGSMGRAGGGRKLSENPDQTVQAYVQVCAGCGTSLGKSEQKIQRRYDKLELPPIKPIVTRVEQYGCKCPQCGEQQIAIVPIGLEVGSPYGNRIAALVTAMRYTHGISYNRMQKLLWEVFGLKISEGAIDNLLHRVKEQLSSEVDGILQRLRLSRVIGSDETSARVNGKNQWEWVFQTEEVCIHVIRPSRGAQVIAEVIGEHRPQIWVSDLFSAQKNHPAAQWQVCLAHQLRDCQYGIEAGDKIFSPVMKRILLKAIVLHRRWDSLAESTQVQYRSRLRRDLDKALSLLPERADGQRLQRRYRDLRENLFLFLEDTTIPPTNNSSEQALRWSVIFRKVTNCFRSEWGRDLFAAVRSVVNTGRRQGLSALDSILVALDPLDSLFSLS